MKVLALGDIHGRSIWKGITARENFDKLVFMGDYFDTHEDISGREQLSNFEAIIQFKLANPTKVVLLTGNHDYHYLQTTYEHYGGYQSLFAAEIGEKLHDAMERQLMQMCHVSDHFIFTHAGITKTWLSQACDFSKREFGKTLEEAINDLFRYKPQTFSFNAGKSLNPFGDDVSQSPIWVRPKSLRQDAIDNYLQVVGHTMQDNLMIGNTAIFIDTLGTSGEYLMIEDGEAFTAK